MHYHTLVTITMVTGFLPSLLRLMERLGAHWSVTKDRDVTTGMLNFCCTHYLWLCSTYMKKKTPNFLEFFFFFDRCQAIRGVWCENIHGNHHPCYPLLTDY